MADPKTENERKFFNFLIIAGIIGIILYQIVK